MLYGFNLTNETWHIPCYCKYNLAFPFTSIFSNATNPWLPYRYIIKWKVLKFSTRTIIKICCIINLRKKWKNFFGRTSQLSQSCNSLQKIRAVPETYKGRTNDEVSMTVLQLKQHHKRSVEKELKLGSTKQFSIIN